MTKSEIQQMLVTVRQAYRDSLDGKSVSFTGVNGRAITNHDPVALRKELEYWEKRWQAVNGRGTTFKLANFL
ncbi:hypothetical protein [Escherichia fergusonii]|uniref:hypothetical protein n=1 Tax=Escherichia fergusonii TaxID=564 RepID=UPI001CBB5E13|nr:hypothetical protein [Escherichia fergusonii]UAT41030.1 hypothetical protein KYC43_05595 [Escherichia fergusonii]